MRSIALCSVAAFLLSVPAIASAESWEDDGTYSKDNWPLQLTKRPLVLAPGMVELAGNTVRINLSKDFAGDPICLAPSLYYGINKKLSAGITHRRGICVSGDACDKTYNDLAVLASYSLMGRGNFHFAAIGGLALPSISDPTAVGLNAGASAKIMAGKIAIEATPLVYVGFTKRDDVKDGLAFPITLQFQVNNQTAVSLETGIESTLSDFGDFYAVPIALTGLFAVSEKIDFGASFRLTNVAGKDGAAGAEAGIDGRELIGRFALRL